MAAQSVKEEISPAQQQLVQAMQEQYRQADLQAQHAILQMLMDKQSEQASEIAELKNMVFDLTRELAGRLTFGGSDSVQHAAAHQRTAAAGAQ